METFLISLACFVLAVVLIIVLAVLTVWVIRKFSKPKFWSHFSLYTAKFKVRGDRRDLVIIGVPIEHLPKEWRDVKKLITKMGYRFGTFDEVWYALDGDTLHVPVVVGCEIDSQEPRLYSIPTKEHQNVRTSGLQPNEVHYCLVGLP